MRTAKEVKAAEAGGATKLASRTSGGSLHNTGNYTDGDSPANAATPGNANSSRRAPAGAGGAPPGEPVAGEGNEPEDWEEDDAMSAASGLEFTPMEPGGGENEARAQGRRRRRHRARGRLVEALGAYIFHSGVGRDWADPVGGA
ncbi:hypothetical protein CYMTET_50624 [Cymbomonas tetramitiformis]|uniref:Uncharacterized protein n=1 Tax=Cymbomonas tetramitiformis TaxID=36881 RepID=A0AAE0EUK3_9CHLO|nr:hypothetical protein CYMTET_50624 [Cymbomonas tetramitiformis]